ELVTTINWRASPIGTASRSGTAQATSAVRSAATSTIVVAARLGRTRNSNAASSSPPSASVALSRASTGCAPCPLLLHQPSRHQASALCVTPPREHVTVNTLVIALVAGDGWLAVGTALLAALAGLAGGLVVARGRGTRAAAEPAAERE